MSDNEEYMKNLYDKALNIKIVGIVTLKDGINSMSLNPGVAYTKELTNYLIDKSKNSDIVKKQLSNKDIDVFSNKKFDDNNKSNINAQSQITNEKIQDIKSILQTIEQLKQTRLIITLYYQLLIQLLFLMLNITWLVMTYY